MTKRARVEESLTTGPFPFGPRRAPKVWTHGLNVKGPSCWCLGPNCHDGSKFCGIDVYSVISADSKNFCHVFEQGDTIDTGQTSIHQTGTIQFQKAYIPGVDDFQLVIYYVPLNGTLNERQRMEYELRASQKRRYEIQCYTFVHCLLHRLGFYRDLRNYIAQRVFEN
jgi:hypothetical protein